MYETTLEGAEGLLENDAIFPVLDRIKAPSFEYDLFGPNG